MRYYSSKLGPTTSAGRCALTQGFCSGNVRNGHVRSSMSQQRGCGGRSTRPNAVAAGVATHGAVALTSCHEIRGALAPSQLAEELHHYAAASASLGGRPGQDAFLASCLSELSAPHRLRRLRPRQLASLLRSLVNLGYNPGEDWLADLDACCYCHPGPFDPASATAVLQALAILHSASSSACVASAASSPPSAAAGAATGAYDTTCPAVWDASPALPLPPARKGQHRNHGSRMTARQQNHRQQQQQQQRHRGHQHRVTQGSSPAGLPLSDAPTPPPSSRGTTMTPTESATTTAAAVVPASYRFPYAVYLRLMQGSVENYSYEQLATLLQSFRCLGVPVCDEVALQIGVHMAGQLMEMAPERRQAALAAVLGSRGACG